MKKLFLLLTLVVSPVSLFAPDGSTATPPADTTATTEAATSATSTTAATEDLTKKLGNTQSAVTEKKEEGARSSMEYKPSSNEENGNLASTAGRLFSKFIGWISDKNGKAKENYSTMVNPIFQLSSDIGSLFDVELDSETMIDHGSSFARAIPVLSVICAGLALCFYGKTMPSNSSSTE